MRVQVVDRQVSKAKFDRQVDEFRALATTYAERGWLLVEADFPTALVVMTARQLPVPAVVTGVAFDYTNYDVEPPSVRLVDPFTRAPYRSTNLPVRLDRRIEAPAAPPLPVGNVPVQLTPLQPFLQWYGTDDVPFLCLPGVYEYHTHPGHSGDAWELHRKTGAGRIVRILEVIHHYGVAPIDNLVIQLNFVPVIQGFHSNPPN